MNIQNKGIPENPQLLDRLFGYIQKGLKESLSWLDEAYGKAERICKYDGQHRRIYIPCVYTNGNDYLSVEPDSGIGNFSFFTAHEPQEVEWIPRVNIGLHGSFSLIFWFDFRKIYNRTGIRDKESVKRQILDVLNTMTLKEGNIRINRVYEQAENIYRGFSIDEIENQYLMHPYGGFRFEGEYNIMENCVL